MKKRYILILIILLAFFITKVNASTNTFDRNLLDNYGINKDLEITKSNLPNILNTPSVDASEKVYDFSDILTDEEEEKVYELIKDFKEKTGMELIFLSDSYSYLYDSKNEDYATDFYDYNDFGIDIEHYSGIIFFRNTYEEPYYGLYFFGKAQLYYSDSRNNNILDNIYNDVHNGYYYDSFESLTNQLLKYYKKGKAPEYRYYDINESGFLVERYHVPWFIAFLVASIGTAVIISILIQKNKMIRKAYKASEYLIKDSIVYSKKEDKFITSHTSSYTVSSSSGSGRSGGGSRSGSSGRGHSGGGRRG